MDEGVVGHHVANNVYVRYISDCSGDDEIESMLEFVSRPVACWTYSVTTAACSIKGNLRSQYTFIMLSMDTFSSDLTASSLCADPDTLDDSHVCR